MSRLPKATVAELDRVAAEQGVSRNAVMNAALEAGLEDFERADAAKIGDPEARARFINRRLARKARARGEQPGAPGPDGLLDFERVDAAKIKDPEARARFVAKRLERRTGSKPAPAAPAPSAAPAHEVLISSAEYDRLLAVRSKRTGTAYRRTAASAGLPVAVRTDDPDLRALRGGK